jgi:DNA-binding response OmpR family regulator
MSSILLVDDDPQVRELVCQMLCLEGHEVAQASNGVEALDVAATTKFDLMITDLIMPDKEGLETIVDMRKRFEDLPIVAMSGGGRVGPADYLETAKFVGANATLTKPFARAELIATVEALLTPSAA